MDLFRASVEMLKTREQTSVKKPRGSKSPNGWFGESVVGK